MILEDFSVSSPQVLIHKSITEDMSQNLQFCVQLDNNHWTSKLDVGMGSQFQPDTIPAQILTQFPRPWAHPAPYSPQDRLGALSIFDFILKPEGFLLAAAKRITQEGQ